MTYFQDITNLYVQSTWNSGGSVNGDRSSFWRSEWLLWGTGWDRERMPVPWGQKGQFRHWKDTLPPPPPYTSYVAVETFLGTKAEGRVGHLQLMVL